MRLFIRRRGDCNCWFSTTKIRLGNQPTTSFFCNTYHVFILHPKAVSIAVAVGERIFKLQMLYFERDLCLSASIPIFGDITMHLDSAPVQNAASTHTHMLCLSTYTLHDLWKEPVWLKRCRTSVLLSFLSTKS